MTPKPRSYLRRFILSVAIFGFALAPSLSNALTLDTTAVESLPTFGPNCYFTALTVNHLLKVPATTLPDTLAAILFLNPALCTHVASPQPGDLGLEERMNMIAHVFTVVGAHQRFEKAGPNEDQKFEFVDTSNTSAQMFVRCSPMEPWISSAINQSGPDALFLDHKLKALEDLIDLRDGPKSILKKAALAKGLSDLEASSITILTSLHEHLETKLRARGIATAPFPGLMNGDYFNFAVEHSELLTDSEIFTALWLLGRLTFLKTSLIYYGHV